LSGIIRQLSRTNLILGFDSLHMNSYTINVLEGLIEIFELPKRNILMSYI
jgi:hypothetical protein